MSTPTIDERVLEVIKNSAIVKDVTVQSRFVEDLEFDSLDAIELILSLEDEFHGLDLDDNLVDANGPIKTVGQAIQHIKDQLAAGANSN